MSTCTLVIEDQEMIIELETSSRYTEEEIIRLFTIVKSAISSPPEGYGGEKGVEKKPLPMRKHLSTPIRDIYKFALPPSTCQDFLFRVRKGDIPDRVLRECYGLSQGEIQMLKTL
jgi:hypothetical protein